MSSTANPSQPPSILGLNHIKLPAYSIAATYAFYTDILPFTPLPEYDHFTPDRKIFAKLCRHDPSGLLLEVRYRPEQAAAQKGWDPVAFGVSTRKDLEKWVEWLDTKSIRHSGILKAINSWVVVCQDPDEKMVRFHVQEEQHAWTNEPDTDAFWLGGTEPDPNLHP